ncbi:MAG: hypothetical protein K0Q49_1761 [Haloplasmataceae bacterium]|jgi:hypothetical protein|nr:hypothetical protein [Haloplasmataceae bacterium]
MNNQKVIFPTSSEKEQSIQFILNQVKTKPSLLKQVRELPISIIFQSSLIVKALTVLTVILYFFLVGNLHLFIYDYTSKHVSILMMFFAPIIYFIHLIDISHSFAANVYELEMTFKYRYHQIIGYKFIVLTFFSLLINFISLLIYPIIDFIEASTTILSSIFIVTSFIYYIVFKFKNPILPLVLIFIWTIINGLLITIFNDNLFNTYKTTIYGIGVIIAFILHFTQFNYVFNHYKAKKIIHTT